MAKENNQAANKSRLLVAMRDSLPPQLLSGKLRVSNAVNKIAGKTR